VLRRVVVLEDTLVLIRADVLAVEKFLDLEGGAAVTEARVKANVFLLEHRVRGGSVRVGR